MPHKKLFWHHVGLDDPQNSMIEVTQATKKERQQGEKRKTPATVDLTGDAEETTPARKRGKAVKSVSTFQFLPVSSGPLSCAQPDSF